jgi:NadR type nicotinamide-nucleotide adenylyltransferase
LASRSSEGGVMTVQRVAILGAESSGKSTLAEALAAHYGTVWVPEYLREFVDTHGRVPFEEDQFAIARMQVARENEAAARATRFVFCDTTPLMTAIYSLHYWQRVDAGLAALDARHGYAFTFVTAPDSPWEEDGMMRESDAVRQRVHGEVLATLAARGIAYTLVTGSLEQRLLQVQAELV